ncbi:MAG: hypothetical protein WD052_08415 [Bacteroidales bacterium]
MILVLIMHFFPLQAQTTSSDPLYRYSVAYFGNNLWNPGVKLGMEYTWKVKNATDHVPNLKRSLQKEWVPGASIGFYLDPGSHAGLFSNAGIGYRRTNGNDRTRYASLNPAGIYRSFLTETYAYDDQGNIERVTLPGNFYYAPAFSIGIGKFTGPDLQSGWFTHLTITTLIPYNHWIMPLINLEVGIMFGKRGGTQ